MVLQKRIINLLIGCFLILNFAILPVQAQENFVEGEDYSVLENPIGPANASVIEFFYFGCRACYQMVPAMAEWSKSSGIPLSVVPTHSETSLVDAARMHHTFAEMGVLPVMYELGYVIYQTEQSELYGEDRINDYLSRNDIDQDRFWQVWNSDAVNQRLAGSLRLSKQAGIYRTPSFVVQGRYLIEVEVISSVEQLYELMEYLAYKDMPETRD